MKKARRTCIHLAAILISVLMHPVLASAQRHDVGLNALDAAFLGTIGADASVALARRAALTAGLRYNPWTFNQGDPSREVRDRIRQVSAGVSLWPWHIFSGTWAGAGVQAREYSRAGIASLPPEEGTMTGVYLEIGHAWMVHQRYNINAGVGLWAGRKAYTTYSCPVCGRITGSGSGTFIEPDRFRISLEYIF